MKVTKNEINKALDNAYTLLESIIPDFKKPVFTEITIGRSRTNWATIGKEKYGKWKLRVSNLFEQIPNEDVAIHRLNETIIHEVIHTLPNCFNHGSEFKRMANKFNRNYPSYNIKRCSESMETYGIVIDTESPYRYKLTCSCGKEFFYKRRRWWFDSLTSVKCTKCGGKDFKLTRI